MERPLKIGLLLDSFEIPAWAYRMLRILNDSEYADITLIVKNIAPGKSKSQKIKDNLNKLFYFGYTYLDRVLFKAEPDAFAPKNLNNLLGEIPIIEVNPIRRRYSDRFPDESTSEIETHDIDIFIRLGFRILRGKILKAARFGVWSFHHGDNKINRGGPAGFWEMMLFHPVTGSILQILNEDLDNGKILYQSWSQTIFTSVNQNRNRYYWKSLSFMPRKIKELYLLGEERFFEQVEKNRMATDLYSDPLYTFPGNWTMFRLLIRKKLYYIGRIINKLFFFRQWALMYSFRDEVSSSFFRFKSLVPPKDRFWADPFPVFKDSKHYIFFEEFPYKTEIGYIAYIELDNNGQHTSPKVVLQQPYHLSYPFIFNFNAEYYMIPETAQNKTVELYRCTEFPDKWEFVMNLMENVNAVDSTVIHHNGKYWLFCNMTENRGASSLDELYLFYSEDFKTDKWIPHPQNPIISDVRCSRPAGRIFEHNGRLIRPSQNSSFLYGYGLKFNEIILMNEREYLEKTIDSAEPNWDKRIKGLHTFNFANGLTVIDTFISRSRFH